MIESSHSQLCKKNSCSVKLQGGPLDHNPRKIPVENSWITILQNNSKCLLLNDKQMHTRYFSVCYRSSRREVFYKKGVLGKYKVSGYFIKKETLAQLFSGEFCEISKNTFFYRKPPVAVHRIPLVAASVCCCELRKRK